MSNFGDKPRFSDEAKSALAETMRAKEAEREQYKETGMKDEFLTYVGNAGLELSEDDREKLGRVFQEYVEGHIHDIADTFGYM